MPAPTRSRRTLFDGWRALAAGCAVAIGLASTSAAAEFSCDPAEPAHYSTEADLFFDRALARWSDVTKRRYLEGTKPCADVAVDGYKDFPTKACAYEASDAGDANKPLAAKVILLDPSAKQLASWSVHACRSGGASDQKMMRCLGNLFDYVMAQNGAQFPVVGSVVESECNSSPRYNSCKGLPPNSPARAPRNTLFRNGVSVSYKTLAHWSPAPIDDQTYAKLFQTSTSDADISDWYLRSRVSGAQREDWEAWRKMKGKPLAPDGVDPQSFKLEASGWGEVSRIVHQSACKSEANELFDAMVFAQKWAK